MKQLLFLLLFPCFALAQYQGNANQKITLGEQTTADGLVWRGIRADTTSKIVPFSDTSAYIILDTVEKTLWLYKAGQIPKWQQIGGSTLDTATMLLPYYRAGRNTIIQATDVPTLNQNTTGSAATLTTGRTIQTNLASTSSASFNGSANITPGVTGTLPVTNGGTNTSTAFTAGSVVFAGTGGTYTQDNSNLFFDDTNNRVGIGLTNPEAKIHIKSDVNGTSNMIFENLQGGPNSSAAIYLKTRNVAGTADVTGIITKTKTGGYYFDNNENSTNAFMQFSNYLTTWMYADGNGRVGIGTTTPTAVLNLKAGTATANTAPLKFTSGTNLTTAEAGAMEFNGTNLFFSPSTTRHTVNHGLTGSATLDFGSTNAQLSTDLTITVTGAADGDVVSLGVPNAAVNANTSYSAWVSAANTVTVRFNNYSSGTVNPASGTFKVFVTK